MGSRSSAETLNPLPPDPARHQLSALHPPQLDLHFRRKHGGDAHTGAALSASHLTTKQASSCSAPMHKLQCRRSAYRSPLVSHCVTLWSWVSLRVSPVSPVTPEKE